MKLKLKGEDLLSCLENGVCKWPEREGRFPQVSGVRFAFDGSKPPGQRVIDGSVMIGEKPLNLKEHYTLATKAYLALGKDGYGAMVNGTELVDAEQGPILPNLLRQNLRMLAALNGFSRSSVRSAHPAW